jgi:glycosyltransferase 2 family protein
MKMRGPIARLSHDPGLRRLRVLSGLALTVALLAWALRGVSPAPVWSAIQSAHFAWLAAGLISFLASMSVRARRWGTLLAAHRDPGPFRIRQSAVFIGFAANTMLPAHTGEIARAVVLRRFARIPLGAAVGSIVAERFLDVIVVLLFLLTPLVMVEQLGSVDLGALRLGWIMAVLALACGTLFVAARWPAAIAEFMGALARTVRLERLAPRIVVSVGSLLSGLDALRNPWRTMTAMVETICMWGLIAFAYGATMRAFDITSPGVPGALFVGAVVSLGVAIPSSPGAVGPFEAALRFALGVYAVPPDIIVAYAVTFRLLVFVGLTTIGLLMAIRLGLSWGDLAPRVASETSTP